MRGSGPLGMPCSPCNSVFSFFFFYLFIWLHHVLVAACGIFSYGMWDLGSQSGIQPRPTVFGARSLSHWTTREVPFFPFLFASNLFL